MRPRAEASGDQHILHGLAGDVVSQPAHRLNNFGVSPAGHGVSRIGRSLDVILDRIRGDLSVFTSEITFTAE